MRRRPAPLPNPSRSRRRAAGEPPPGLIPSREDLLRLLAVLAIATAAAAACSLLNRRPEPYCDSLQAPDDYAGGTADLPLFFSFFFIPEFSPLLLPALLAHESTTIIVTTYTGLIIIVPIPIRRFVSTLPSERAMCGE